MIEHQAHLNAYSYLPEYGQSVSWVSLSGEVQVYLWMLRCGNIILLTLRLLDVAKFTNLTPLSLLISCKLSFLIVSLNVFPVYFDIEIS
jgi:hypothetical protein